MYKKGPQGWLKHLDFILLDLLSLYLAFMLAYAVRMSDFNFYSDEAYSSIAIVLVLANVAVTILFNSFKNVLKRGHYQELSASIKHVCLVEVVVIVYIFTIQESIAYSQFILYLTAIFYFFLSYVTRTVWKKYLRRVMKSGDRRSLIIVTVDGMAGEVVKNILDDNFEQFRIAGLAILDRDRRGQTIEGVSVIACARDVTECVCRGWIDEALFCMPQNETCPEKLMTQFMEMGVVVHMSLYHAFGNGGQKQFVERLCGYTVLTSSINYATPLQQFIKRSIDIAGALLGSLITCVLFVFLAPAIYIHSPGPVFFRQERVGRNGKRFRMYKFRSMYLDAEERKKELMEQNRIEDGFMFKLEGDPRIIGCRVTPDGKVKKGIGNFIRDWSLDEFPQFFNVLKGDMSLVGTRPPTVDEWERYELHHRARLATRPGITGLWQVSGRSNITDFEDVVKLDTKYITEWSMGLDLRILCRTVGVVLGKKGAM